MNDQRSIRRSVSGRRSRVSIPATGQVRAIASREDDERVLAIMRMLDRGYGTDQVGAAFGYTRSYVRALRSRVTRAYAESEA